MSLWTVMWSNSAPEPYSGAISSPGSIFIGREEPVLSRWDLTSIRQPIGSQVQDSGTSPPRISSTLFES